MIEFQNGKLTFATRSWNNKNGDAVDALFGAVSYFNNEGRTVCSIFADTTRHPKVNIQKVWITCGNKSILITKMTGSDHAGEFVEEILGAVKSDADEKLQ